MRLRLVLLGDPGRAGVLWNIFGQFVWQKLLRSPSARWLFLYRHTAWQFISATSSNSLSGGLGSGVVNQRGVIGWQWVMSGGSSEMYVDGGTAI